MIDKGVKMSRLRVNILNLLRFYDEDEEAHSHSSAIKAMAGEDLGVSLLRRYLKSQGKRLVLLEGNGKRLACTTGGRKGYQLDGWIKVTDVEGAAAPVFYQMEIKSWSRHGIGSSERTLPVNCVGDDLLKSKKRLWKYYWDQNSCNFFHNGIKKVLLKMAPPNVAGFMLSRPLLCMWEAVHPGGRVKDEPFFTVRVDSKFPYMEKDDGVRYPAAGFSEVDVFSMSAYLRMLLAENKKTIVLCLPQVYQRMTKMSEIFRL